MVTETTSSKEKEKYRKKLERFSNSAVNQLKFKANTRNRYQAWEIAREEVAIGFGFVSDWLRKGREFC